MEKQKLMRSSIYAWIFIVAYAAMLPVQRISGAFDFDQITVAVGLVIGAYIGIDGWAGIVKTGTMPAGQKYSGNRAKLEAIVVASMVLVIEGLLLQYIMVSDPEAGVVFYDLPLTALISMCAGVTAVFLGVEKGKTVAEERGPK